MRHPWIVLIYSIAMGVLEAAVVVYLRRIYYPAGFGLPLVAMDPFVLRVEIAREAATIVMIACVALLAAPQPWSRLMAFLVVFGAWDLAYYAGLKLWLGWPARLFEPDILFLIPKVWVGPVIAPALVAATWVAGGLLLHRRRFRDLRMGWKSWAAAIAAAALILASFLGPLGPAGEMRFSWGIYLAGYALGLVTLARLIVLGRKAERRKAEPLRAKESA